MTITLPDALARWVAERAARLGYESADAYVADLVEAEMNSDIPAGPAHLTPSSQEELDRMLLEGLEGEPIVADEAFWDERRRVLAERTDELHKARS